MSGRMTVVKRSKTWLLNVDKPTLDDVFEDQDPCIERWLELPQHLLPGLSFQVNLSIGKDENYALLLSPWFGDKQARFRASWEFSLLSEDGSAMHTSRRPMAEIKADGSHYSEYPCRDFDASAFRSVKRQSGKLELRLDMVVEVPAWVETRNRRLAQEKNEQERLLQKRNKTQLDLDAANVYRSMASSIYRNTAYSDFTVVVGKRDFAVHRCVLAHFSSVFAAMFENEMKERSANSVTLDDTTPEAFESFLGALYCGEYQFLEDLQTTQDVLYLANKYAIAAIKTTCDVCLATFVNASNALGILMETAAFCDAEASKAKCLDVLCDHVTWLESSDWLDFKVRPCVCMLECTSWLDFQALRKSFCHASKNDHRASLRNMARERRSPSVARQGYSYSPSDLSRYLDGLPDDRLPNLYLRLELDGWRALSSRQSSATAGDCSLWLWSDAYGALRDFYAEWTWRLLAEDGSVLHTSHTPMRGFCPPSFVDPLYPPENGHKCRDFNTSVLRNAKQPDGTLSIQIELTVKVPQLVQDQIRLGEEADALKLKLRRRNKALRQANVFRSTLASMRNDKTFSDFTIVVGKRDFAVNRCVLATRSPVFAAMFEKEMQEKANNHVTLDDTTPEAFESFLGALYGCEYHFLAKMEATQDVLSLANKYCVADIKTTCDVRLAAFVNESNAMKVLMETAALCNAEATKAKCIELLCGHVTWLESSDWLDFKADHSRLAAGIISDLTKLQAAKAAKRKRMLTKEAARGRARFRSCRKNAIRQFREEVKEKQDWDDATGLPRLPSFINALCIDAIAGGVQDD